MADGKSSFDGNFEYLGGNITVTTRNIVFSNKNSFECKGVRVSHMPDGYAQWDYAINVGWILPRKRKWDDWSSLVIPDGLLGVSIAVDGVEVWNSENFFPLFDSLRIAKANRPAQHELERARSRDEISAPEFLEKLRELVSEANHLSLAAG